MKYLVDTCGWIEWLVDSKLSKHFKKYLSAKNNLYVPTLIQFELYKWIVREKDDTIASEVIGYTEQCNVIELSTVIALTAADFSRKYKLAAADSIVYATTTCLDAQLITCDKHFADLPNVKYFEK